jgi:hypothetical protein
MTHKIESIQLGRRQDASSQFISMIVLAVLAVGTLAVVAPALASQPELTRMADRYLPSFFLGLMAIAVLLNIYLFTQKRTGNWARPAQARARSNDRKQQSRSLVDPVTQLLSSALGVARHAEHSRRTPGNAA